MRRLTHRALAHAWMLPVRALGWCRALPQRLEAACQRRSAHHLLRALNRTPEQLAAALQRKRSPGG